jgi:hypothetical protein
MCSKSRARAVCWACRACTGQVLRSLKTAALSQPERQPAAPPALRTSLARARQVVLLGTRAYADADQGPVSPTCLRTLPRFATPPRRGRTGGSAARQAECARRLRRSGRFCVTAQLSAGRFAALSRRNTPPAAAQRVLSDCGSSILGVLSVYAKPGSTHQCSSP